MTGSELTDNALNSRQEETGITFQKEVLEEIKKYDGIVISINQTYTIEGKNTLYTCKIEIDTLRVMLAERGDLNELHKNYTDTPNLESVTLGSISNFEPEVVEDTSTQYLTRRNHSHEEDYIFISNNGLIWMLDSDTSTVFHISNSITEFITRRPIAHYNREFIASYKY